MVRELSAQFLSHRRTRRADGVGAFQRVERAKAVTKSEGPLCVSDHSYDPLQPDASQLRRGIGHGKILPAVVADTKEAQDLPIGETWIGLHLVQQDREN